MDLGFSRRAVKHSRKKLDGMSYHALMAELIAAQTDSPTSRAQRQLGAHNAEEVAPEGHSFHAPTADLLREAKEE